MAGLTCTICHSPNTEGATDCKVCGHPFAGGGDRQAPDQQDGPVTAQAPEEAPDKCPACAAVVPDPRNSVCVDCLEPLTPRPAKQPVPPTRRAAAALRLLFAGQPVDVAPAGSVLLGRDPEHSPVATLFAAHDNVSRRHASVGVEPDGRAWVRDEHSTNGTFVNGKRVPSGHTAPLVHGDQLRIASDMVARVEFGHDGRSA